jgi:isopentenyl diphosphate isomerase/L-lactate dehydrogenase-like FMN-dependent dehydrogenase
MPTILALPEIVEAVRKRVAVIVDSGFRRGSHVVKALALGADAVMIGRAPLHGTATAGEAGARRAIAIYREEIDRVMALLGCARVADLKPEHLVMPSPEAALASEA